MGEWKEIPFNEAFLINPKIQIPKNIPIPFVDMQALDSSSKFVISAQKKEFTGSGSKFQDGDTLFARITPCLENGKIAQYKSIDFKKEGFGSTEFIVIRGRDRVSTNDFAYYFSRSNVFREFAISQMNGSSGRQRVPVEALGAFMVNLPKINIQEKIASILSSIDDKIELNRKMNETLEEMARAIFKSWFVDFDPVHAKARGEKPAGMPDEIADLFPSEFVHSDQLNKPIPKGWEVKPLGEIFNLTMGQSPPGNTYNQKGEGVPFYQGRTDFGFRFPIKRIYCNAPKRMAEQFDILVSVRAPVGDVNVANEVCCIGRGIAALKHKSGSFSYSYYSIKNLESVFNSYESGGTVFGSINQKEFNSLKILEPSPELIKAFELCISCVDEKILNNSQQIIVLQEERDSLLPKLISGEIEV